MNFLKSLAFEARGRSISLTLQNASFGAFAHRQPNGFVVFCVELQVAQDSHNPLREPLISSKNILRRAAALCCVQGAVSAPLVPNSPHCMREHDSNHRPPKSILARLRPNADVKQTSNESETLVTCADERQVGTYGDFRMMTREGGGGGLRALKLDCRV